MRGIRLASAPMVSTWTHPRSEPSYSIILHLLFPMHEPLIPDRELPSEKTDRLRLKGRFHRAKAGMADPSNASKEVQDNH